MHYFYLQKSGKWCAVHVRVAWEIYHHQQKQSAEGGKPGSTEGKPPSAGGDSLRPPSHLLPPGSAGPGPSLHRPDLPGSSLLPGNMSFAYLSFTLMNITTSLK